MYSMYYLKYWDSAFAVAPILALILGIICVMISVYGFATTGYENRGLLIIFAILLSIAFIIQVACLFVFLQVRSQIDQECCPLELRNSLKEYNANTYITNSLDEIQQNYKCCGFRVGEGAYRDWEAYSTQTGLAQGDVPDSCCSVSFEDCGKIRHLDEDRNPQLIHLARNRIFTASCRDMLQNDMENDVLPMIYAYCGIGVILSIIELITIFLVCALVLQISTRLRKEDLKLNSKWSDQVLLKNFYENNSETS